MEEAEIEIAKVAVGGIRYEDIYLLMQSGVNGLAVSGAIAMAKDMAEETHRFLEALSKYQPKASDAV